MKYLFAISIVLTLFLVSSCGGRSGNRSSNGDYDKISRIYNSQDGHTLLFDAGEKKGNILISDNNCLFTVLQIAADSNWVIVEKAPFNPGSGRVETEKLLFYIPESRLFDLNALNPALSVFGMVFSNNNGIESLNVIIEGDYEVLDIPLASLLRGEIPIIPEKEREINGTSDDTPFYDPDAEPDTALTTTGNEGVVLALILGKEDEHIGQGTVDSTLKGGRSIYAIPSFAARDNRLYIIDAINFRILVYDYSGNFIRRIVYPESLPDRSMIVARDIALDDVYIYLLSVYENAVYVIDTKTEDIAAIIEGAGTPEGKFGALASVQTDHNGNILILDTIDNTLYTFKRENVTFSLTRKERYNQPGQLVPSPGETVYFAEAIKSGYRIYHKEIELFAHFKCKHPVNAAEVFATDRSGNVYIKLTEADPMTQFWGPVTVRVVSSKGEQIYSLNVGLWTNGPMKRNLVVDREGNIFESTFDGMPDDADWPATKLEIRRIK